MATPRLLLPMWLAALALHGVVGLYWYSIGPGEYRFPTLAASALFATGIAAIAWWWFRATAMLSEERRELVSTRAQMRYRRLALLISYALGCASVALAAGIQGNDLSWQRFTDGDPQIKRAVATEMTDWENEEVGWTGYLDGYSTIDGVRYEFFSEPVDFEDAEEEVDLAVVEVWAVFDPDDLDAGLVVVRSRADAQTVIDRPMEPLLPFVLVIAACCWAVQRLRVRSRSFPERFLDPIDRTPASLWLLFAIPCVLWVIGIVWVAAVAGDGEPHQPQLSSTAIAIWMICLLPAAYCFGRFFDSAAASPVKSIRGLSEFRPGRR
ncbi:hypothetical protein [Glycomyces sp. YM15]|uniref:hypothetical protein n=1 Tax=Glycomyces sp. YM15 TaxID=2800446 RepID=UPI00196535E8|nr:hypothetical protein [Glycomyces sp. YM15]